MQSQRQKRILQDTRDGLRRYTTSLVGAGERIADFGLALIVLLNLQSTIANEHSRFLEFDSDLKPLARHAWLDLLLLLKKSTCLGFTDPLPTLVSGDFGVITIGHEECEVSIPKVSQAQSGCLKRRGNCHRQWHLSHMQL